VGCEATRKCAFLRFALFGASRIAEAASRLSSLRSFRGFSHRRSNIATSCFCTSPIFGTVDKSIKEGSKVPETDTRKIGNEQLAKLEKIRQRIAQLEAREQAILSRKSRQERADETRRAIVLGKRLEGLSGHDKRARAMVEILLNDLEEQFRYLFPEKWPDAQRPRKMSAAK
jgi:hypothetical protein